MRPRGVAQFGSAPALGAGCRRFESCHPDAQLASPQLDSSPLERVAFLLLGEGCAQNVRKALSAGLVLRTTFRASGPACGHPRHTEVTERDACLHLRWETTLSPDDAHRQDLPGV